MLQIASFILELLWPDHYNFAGSSLDILCNYFLFTEYSAIIICIVTSKARMLIPVVLLHAQLAKLDLFLYTVANQIQHMIQFNAIN